MAEFEMDPLRLLPQEVPNQYAMLSDEEKAVRGRYFLLVFSMGAGVEYAWFNALSAEPQHNAEMKVILSTITDDAIIEAVRNRDDPERPVMNWEATPV